MQDPVEFPQVGQTSEQTALASTARTAGANGSSMINVANRGISIVIDITVNAASAANISAVSVQAIGPSGTYTTIYTFTGLTMAAIGQYHFLVYPGSPAAASWKAAPLSGPIPRHFRIATTHTDANPITYSASVVQIP